MMKHFCLLMIMLPLVGLSQSTSAPYCDTIPKGSRVIDHLPAPVPGCFPGIEPDDWPARNQATPNETVRHIQVSPSSIVGKAGTTFNLTYDGSYICKGQTILNEAGTPMAFDQDLKPVKTPVDKGWITVGTVDWGDAVENLTRTYGVLCHKYSSGGPRDIRIEFNLRCADYGDKSCPWNGKPHRSVTVHADIAP